MGNFKTIMESWRGFKTLLNERVKPESSYPTTYQSLRQMIEELSDKTWIFFDTETTGLFMEEPYSAITQIAAIKVKINNFDPTKDIEIVEKFNRLIELPERSIRYIRDEEKNWEQTMARWKAKEEEKKLQFDEKENALAQSKPNYKPKQYKYGLPPYPVLKALNMTGYKTPEEISEEYGVTIISLSEEDMKTNPAYHDNERTYYVPTQVLQEFAEFCSPTEDILMVAQNAPFDVKYINVAFRRAGLEVPNDEVLDTVTIFKKFLTPVVSDLESKLSNNQIPEDQVEEATNIVNNLIKVSEGGRKSSTVSLGPITKAFNVKDEGWHNALADVVMLAKVMKQIINFLDKNEFVGSIEYNNTTNNAHYAELENEVKELEKWFQTAQDTPRDAPERYQRGESSEMAAYRNEYWERKKELKALKDELYNAKKRKPPSDGKPSTTDLSESKIRIKIKR